MIGIFETIEKTSESICEHYANAINEAVFCARIRGTEIKVWIFTHFGRVLFAEANNQDILIRFDDNEEDRVVDHCVRVPWNHWLVQDIVRKG